MKILSLLSVSLDKLWCFFDSILNFLWHFSSNILFWNVMMGCDFIKLYFTSVVLFSVFNLVLFLLDSVEALDLMFGHSVWLASYWRNVLDETNHGSVALGIKLFVVTRLDLTESANTFFLCSWIWVLSQLRFKIISEVGNESHSIFKFNVESLIIDWGPVTLYHFGVAFLIIWAENGLCLVVFHNVNTVDIFSSKLEQMLLIH